jgi:trimeric autotransporter adhesin
MIRCSKAVAGLLLCLSQSLLAQSTLPYLVEYVGGRDNPAFERSGASAAAALFYSMYDVAADGAGNVYVSLRFPARIVKIAPGGSFTTVLERVSSSPFQAINAVVVDAAGNIYFSDSIRHVVRKLSASGTLSIFAGKERSSGFSGDGGQAAEAQLNSPGALAVDPAGNVYIADASNYRARVVNPAGVIRTLAGTGTYGSGGDGATAAAATIGLLDSIAADGAGNVYLVDTNQERVRRVNAAGVIDTVLGTGTGGFNGDSNPPKSTRLNMPRGLAVDGAGSLYVAEQNGQRVRKMTMAGVVSTIAGTGVSGYAGDGGNGAAAKVANPLRVAADALGNVYIMEHRRIRKVTTAGVISTFAGSNDGALIGDGGPVENAFFDGPEKLTADAAGNIYIADQWNYRVRKVSTDGIVSTVAGTGVPGYSGDGGPATNADLDYPISVAVDNSGNVYLSDRFNGRVRKVTPGGTISTYAGGGTGGYSPANQSGIPAVGAVMLGMHDLTTDAAGNLYIADGMRLRKVTAGGTISDVAGFTGQSTTDIRAVAVDASGNLCATGGTSGYQILKSTAGGAPVVIAGNGQQSYSGDGGAATAAGMRPMGVAMDGAGNVYLSDSSSGRVRVVSTDGKVNTIGGGGSSSDDGVPALSASGIAGLGIARHSGGKIYFFTEMAVGSFLRKLEQGQIFRTGLLNAASFRYTPVSPGELVTIFPMPGSASDRPRSWVCSSMPAAMWPTHWARRGCISTMWRRP